MLLLLNLIGAAAAPVAAGDSYPALDEQLVAAAQADPRAFAALYECYLDRIYRFCYNRLGERQAAEDATSEIFLRALAHLPNYRSGSFGAWLYTIAHSVVIAHYRKERLSEPLDGADAGWRGLAAEPLADHAERAALLIALGELPDDQRTAVELPAAGWSDTQISEILGKSAAAVRMLRYRAMQRLHQLLADDSAGEQIGEVR
ncbi:MAG: RNA polymerase sigma factor [Caldilineaceae bacterium]